MNIRTPYRLSAPLYPQIGTSEQRISSMFLASNQDIRREIQNLIENDPVGPTMFAVAFWGRGAEHIPKGPARIICDLYSGACNPDVIATLRELPSCRVFYLDGLHAKVVINKAGAVVSSGNMSYNGLGQEGIDGSGTFEAGLRVSPGDRTHDEIGVWFERMWELARPVTDLDLHRARRIYDAKNNFVVPDLKPDEDAPGLRFRRIAPHELLMDEPKMEYRVRPVKQVILRIAEQALPGLAPQMLGKIATYACHAILCRAGVDELNYTKKGSDPGGTVTEAWIAGRFKDTGSQTRARVDAVLLKMAGEPNLQPPISQLAAEVLASPAWVDL